MTYCLSREKHSNNMASKSVTMTNKVLRQKSKCSVCFSDKSRFLKQDHSKKCSNKNIIKKWSLIIIKQTC